MDPERTMVDIDPDIKFFQNLLSLYPRSHLGHFLGIHILSMVRLNRYMLSQHEEDLDKCIDHCTEAIFLPPVSQAGLSTVELLFQLALALLRRSKKYKQPDDVKYSIEYLRYLRGLPRDSFGLPRNKVITSLIQALAIQVDSGAGEGTRNIKEMVVLCRELLTSENLTDDLAAAFPLLNDAVTAEVAWRHSVQSLDEVIECLRDVVKMCPLGSSLFRVLFALANILHIRSAETRSIDDFEETTSLLERILDPNQPGECPNRIRFLASSLAAMLPYTRMAVFEKPQYSEVTTSRLCNLPNSSFVDEGLHLPITEALAIQARKLSIQYSPVESLEAANSYTPQLVDLPSPQSLEKSGELYFESSAVRESYSMRIAKKIQQLEEEVFSTSTGIERHKECCRHLANWYEIKFRSTNDISDLEESIKYSRLSVDASKYSSVWEKVIPLRSLHNILFLAFEKTNETSYLYESITVGNVILKLEVAQHIHFPAIQKLVFALLAREKLSGRREDLLEILRLIPLVVDNQYTQEPDQFQLSCQQGLLAQIVSHFTALAAYKSAMSLMKKSLTFAPTVSIHHSRLVAMGEFCQIMPLDYASLQIELGRFEEAIETLEQGRALFRSEMRGLRSPIAQLIEEDSPLAKRFSEVNQELEALTVSITSGGWPEMKGGVAKGRDGTDPHGRLVVTQQELVEERAEVISQIQGRPELEGFLKAPSFATLHSAASRGPVILINHCKWRSDILIIFHNYLPCSIPTANGFYDHANKLRDELVEARKHGLNSGEYQDALCFVLKDLYELVGKPVIQKLRVLGVPEQSRIWWYPTSVFCYLPLHAMGPIPSDDTSNERYFSDLYIPSYTSSLSALIESRNASLQILDKPSFLLVAQPDDSLPGVNGEIKVIRRALKARATVASLVSSEATPSSVVEGLQGSRFAHFACHGVLETGKLLEAVFELHEGSRLTLLDIVQSQLPNAEFAFLSCCHTAEITEESLAGEALHLTAAMQYCGFRSVVGTMWAMADTDGRDLAESFYKSLFSRREAGVPYYEQSARALRHATQKLRRKRGITLERWVNFVHYGA